MRTGGPLVQIEKPDGRAVVFEDPDADALDVQYITGGRRNGVQRLGQIAAVERIALGQFKERGLLVFKNP